MKSKGRTGGGVRGGQGVWSLESVNTSLFQGYLFPDSFKFHIGQISQNKGMKDIKSSGFSTRLHGVFAHRDYHGARKENCRSVYWHENIN